MRCDCGKDFVAQGRRLVARRRIDCGCVRAVENGQRMREKMKGVGCE